MEKFVAHPVFRHPTTIKSFWVDMHVYLVDSKAINPPSKVHRHIPLSRAEDELIKQQRTDIITNIEKHYNTVLEGVVDNTGLTIYTGPKAGACSGWMKSVWCYMGQYLAILISQLKKDKYDGDKLFEILRAIRNLIAHLLDKPRHFEKFVGLPIEKEYWRLREKCSGILKDGAVRYWMETFPELLFCTYSEGVALKTIGNVKPAFPSHYYPDLKHCLGLQNNMFDFLNEFSNEIHLEKTKSKGLWLQGFHLNATKFVFLKYQCDTVPFPADVLESVAVNISLKSDGSFEYMEVERLREGITMKLFHKRTNPKHFKNLVSLIIFTNCVGDVLKTILNHSQLPAGAAIFTTQSFQEVNTAIRAQKKAPKFSQIKEVTLHWDDLDKTYQALITAKKIQLHQNSPFTIMLDDFKDDINFNINKLQGDHLLRIMHDASPILLKTDTEDHDTPIYYESRVLLSETPTRCNDTNEDEIVNLLAREKDQANNGAFVVISAHFGMGKSCLMKKVLENLSSLKHMTQPTTFEKVPCKRNVARYSTAKDLSLRMKTNPMNDAFEKLWLFWDNTEFIKGVLKIFVERSQFQITLFLDGYDEVPGVDRDAISKLLSEIRDKYSAINIVVATRSTCLDQLLKYQNNLEDHVHYSLQPIEQDTRKSLVLSYWQDLYNSDDQLQVEAVAAEICKIAEEEVGEFAKTPLACKLLATRYAQDIRDAEYKVEPTSSQLYDAIVDNILRDCFVKYILKEGGKFPHEDVDEKSFIFSDIATLTYRLHHILAIRKTFGQFDTIIPEVKMSLKMEENLNVFGLVDTEKQFVSDGLLSYFLASFVFTTIQNMHNHPMDRINRQLRLQFQQFIMYDFLSMEWIGMSIEFKHHQSVKTLDDMLYNWYKNRQVSSRIMMMFNPDIPLRHNLLQLVVKNGFNFLLWAFLDNLSDYFDTLFPQSISFDPDRHIPDQLLQNAVDGCQLLPIRYLIEKCQVPKSVIRKDVADLVEHFCISKHSYILEW